MPKPPSPGIPTRLPATCSIDVMPESAATTNGAGFGPLSGTRETLAITESDAPASVALNRPAPHVAPPAVT